MPKLIDWIKGATAPPETARIFIVDTSSAMSSSLGGRSKFQSVLDEIKKMTERNPHGVAYALRTTDGGCEYNGEWHAPLVPFTTGNGESINAELRTAHIGGPADVAAAIQQATDDFRRYGDAKSAKFQGIWLFLATTRDDCDRASLPLAAAIKSALRDTKAELNGVDFFFLGGEKKRYARFSHAIQGFCSCFAFYAATPTELHTAVDETAMREEPSQH